MEFITGALLIALGVAAIGLPLITSLSVSYLVACAFGAGGLVHLAGAITNHRLSHSALQAFVGLLYLVIAVLIVRNPLWSMTTLALVVSATLVAEGMVTLVAPFLFTDAPGSLWLLMSAIVTIAAGFVAWSVSLIVPAVVVASLVGVALIANGTGRIVTAFEESRLTV